MKIFKIVLVGAIALSGYLGYSNFIEMDLGDYVDIAIKIGQTLSPFIAPALASRKRTNKQGEIKTLDDDIGDVAMHLGVSPAFVKGKLGLGDRRKKQTTTKRKRRSSDIKSRT